MELLRTIALSAITAVLTAPVCTDAKTKPHHHARAAAHAAGLSNAERDEALEQRISQMQAQINSLQAKLDQQGTAQVAAADQATQATQIAAAAQATADKAQASAAAVTVAETKTDKTVGLMKWAQNTQINGRMFFDTSNIHQKTAGNNNANSGTGFNIKRFYFGVDHQFSPVFAGTLLMDISNVIGETPNQNYVTPSVTAGAPTCVTTASATVPIKYTTTCTAAPAANLATAAIVGKGFYIKQAYLQAKLDPALIIRAGSAALPWVPYVEGHYGFRQIENESIDRLNYGTTADWGLHVLGDLGHGLISYQISAIDGGGYRNVKVTKYIDLEGRLSAQYKGLWAAVGGYTGKRANGVQELTGAAFPPTFRTAKRLNAAGGYSNAMFNVGGEYFYAKNWNNVVVNPIIPATGAETAYSQDSARGYSLFGNVNFTPKWTVFGRYDWNEPNRITDRALRDHYFNAGLQWEPVKIVDIALVYKRETAKNGAIATTDGVIGCGTTATPNSFASFSAQTSGTCIGNGTYDEVGLFGQFKF